VKHHEQDNKKKSFSNKILKTRVPHSRLSRTLICFVCVADRKDLFHINDYVIKIHLYLKKKTNKRLYHDLVVVVVVVDTKGFVIKLNNFIHVNSCFIVHSVPL
jgi:hypothetical protein